MNDFRYFQAKQLVYGEDPSSLLQSLSVVTTRTIENSLIFGGDLRKTNEILTAVVQESSVTPHQITLTDIHVRHADIICGIHFSRNPQSVKSFLELFDDL